MPYSARSDAGVVIFVSVSEPVSTDTLDNRRVGYSTSTASCTASGSL